MGLVPAHTRLHWSFEDPAAFNGNETERLNKFREVRDLIEARVKKWVEVERKEG